MGQYIALPDPCPHVSRLELIALKLHPDDADDLDEALLHIADCTSTHNVQGAPQ